MSEKKTKKNQKHQGDFGPPKYLEVLDATKLSRKVRKPLLRMWQSGKRECECEGMVLDWYKNWVLLKNVKILNSESEINHFWIWDPKGTMQKNLSQIVRISGTIVPYLRTNGTADFTLTNVRVIFFKTKTPMQGLMELASRHTDVSEQDSDTHPRSKSSKSVPPLSPVLFHSVKGSKTGNIC